MRHPSHPLRNRSETTLQAQRRGERPSISLLQVSSHRLRQALPYPPLDAVPGNGPCSTCVTAGKGKGIAIPTLFTRGKADADSEPIIIEDDEEEDTGTRLPQGKTDLHSTSPDPIDCFTGEPENEKNDSRIAKDGPATLSLQRKVAQARKSRTPSVGMAEQEHIDVDALSDDIEDASGFDDPDEDKPALSRRNMTPSGRSMIPVGTVAKNRLPFLGLGASSTNGKGQGGSRSKGESATFQLIDFSGFKKESSKTKPELKIEQPQSRISLMRSKGGTSPPKVCFNLGSCGVRVLTIFDAALSESGSVQ